jgi:hypothetical protein
METAKPQKHVGHTQKYQIIPALLWGFAQWFPWKFMAGPDWQHFFTLQAFFKPS